jgi:hypothetical protein
MQVISTHHFERLLDHEFSYRGREEQFLWHKTPHFTFVKVRAESESVHDLAGPWMKSLYLFSSEELSSEMSVSISGVEFTLHTSPQYVFSLSKLELKSTERFHRKRGRAGEIDLPRGRINLPTHSTAPHTYQSCRVSRSIPMFCNLHLRHCSSLRISKD